MGLEADELRGFVFTTHNLTRKAVTRQPGVALVHESGVRFRGTVKLTKNRLTDPQDDGLESCRERGMLGVGQLDSA